MRRVFILAIAILAVGCSSHSVAPSPTRISPEIYQKRDPGTGWFQTSIPNVNRIAASPFGITLDASNHVWVSDTAGAISEIGMDQDVQSFSLSIKPRYITVGSDSNLWVTGGGAVARVTPQGSETDYNVAPSATLGNIISGPDGALWFPECGVDRSSGGIGRIDTSGAYTYYPSVCQWVVANGPDGNIWFGDKGSNIYNMTTQGALVGTYPVGDIYFINSATGSDGALYFIAGTSSGNDELVRVTTTGIVTHIGPDPYGPRGRTALFRGITNGPGEMLWLSAANHHAEYITTFDPASQTYSRSHTIDGDANGQIVEGPDGNFWIAAGGDGDEVFTYVRLAMTLVPKSLSVPVGQNINLGVSEANYSGQWTATSVNPAIATVTLNSNNGSFTVTGVAPGKTTVTVYDTMFISIRAGVTVP
jgi:streptogramin lyase